MTVVLLDPLRPTTIPMEAVGVVGGGVAFTDEVPESVRTLLSAAPGAAVLISTDPDHPTVREWVASGSRIIAAPKVPGDNLVEAAEVMDRLWSYGGWEVTQTHRTLSHYLVEETYEVLDAIESAEPGDLREELGDLLLQVLFHSRIASASGNFDVDDVAATLVAKLVHRSPHLGEDVVGPIDIAEQERAWEIRKAAEKARSSCLDGVAMSQPALALAEKVTSRAKEAGLPSQLVPAQLRMVRLGGDVSAEDELRRAALSFIECIRATEVSAHGAGIRPGELDEQAWVQYWAG